MYGCADVTLRVSECAADVDGLWNASRRGRLLENVNSNGTDEICAVVCDFRHQSSLNTTGRLIPVVARGQPLARLNRFRKNQIPRESNLGVRFLSSGLDAGPPCTDHT